jgi:hypothetical protein
VLTIVVLAVAKVSKNVLPQITQIGQMNTRQGFGHGLHGFTRMNTKKFGHACPAVQAGITPII